MDEKNEKMSEDVRDRTIALASKIMEAPDLDLMGEMADALPYNRYTIKCLTTIVRLTMTYLEVHADMYKLILALLNEECASNEKKEE